MATVHIGKKIKDVLSQKPISVVEFAEKINKTRTVVYDIFKRNSIDSSLLSKISKVLDHDFFLYYNSDKGDLGRIVKEREGNYGKRRDQVIILQMELEDSKRRLEDLQKQNELLSKLVALMEKSKSKRRR